MTTVRDGTVLDSAVPAIAVSRVSLREEVAAALGDDLVTGRLSAGEPVTVNDVARRFGVSATPVREALIQLATEGLLEGGHHRGYQVATYTWSDFTEIVECRRLIGVPLIGRVARTIPDESVERLRPLALHLDTAAWTGDIAPTALADRQFFAGLARWCGNGRSARMLELMRIQGWMYILPFLRAASGPAPGWRRYRELADRLAAHDDKGAQELMRDNVAASRTLAAAFADAG